MGGKGLIPPVCTCEFKGIFECPVHKDSFNSNLPKVDIWNKPEDKLPKLNIPIVWVVKIVEEEGDENYIKHGYYGKILSANVLIHKVSYNRDDNSFDCIEDAIVWCYESDLIKTIGGKV